MWLMFLRAQIWNLLMLDVFGNPYASDTVKILSRNMDFTPEALKILEGMC